MPDLSKVYVSTETLDLSTGSGQFNTPAQCDVTKVVVSGVVGATEAVVNVDGVDVATITLDGNGDGSVVTVGVTDAADAVANTGTAQDGRNGKASTALTRLGVVKQANATDVGYANVIGPEVANPVPVADNVAAGKVVKVTATGATAGSAVVTLDTAGSAVGVNPNPNTDSSY